MTPAGSMIVTALSTKAGGASSSLTLIGGVGIAGPDAGLAGVDGDRHADPLSPRHLLLASAPVLSAHGLAPGSIWDNLTISADIEALPSGSLLAIGDTVLRLTFRCEACHRLDTVRPGLSAALVGRRGYLARVVRGGTLSVDDPVAVWPRRLRAIPDPPRDRLADLLTRIPAGQVTTYRQLRTTLGYPAAYLRAVPAWLKRLAATHRVVKLPGPAPLWDPATYFADELPLA